MVSRIYCVVIWSITVSTNQIAVAIFFANMSEGPLDKIGVFACSITVNLGGCAFRG